MLDVVNQLITDVMSSPWIYLAIFLVSAIDAFFPAVPSESSIIAAAVFAGTTGHPQPLLLIAVAAIGAYVGDNISYLIGRTCGGWVLDRLTKHPKRMAAYDWAKRALLTRGGLMIVAARYIPGGRTATTMVAGSLRYPVARFQLFTLLAAASWSTYSVLIGLIGGVAFEDNPLAGVLLGFGIAAAITVAVELGRLWYRRRTTRATESAVSTESTESAVSARPTPDPELALRD